VIARQTPHEASTIRAFIEASPEVDPAGTPHIVAGEGTQFRVDQSFVVAVADGQPTIVRNRR